MNLHGFTFPPDRYYLLARDMWALPLDDGRMRVGITAFGVHLSGNFFMCRPKPVGTMVEQDATLAVAELNKSVVTIKSPVTGQVDAVNPLLAATPEIIEEDPYGQGWLAELQPTRWAQDLTTLAHGDTLEAAMRARMQLENLDDHTG